MRSVDIYPTKGNDYSETKVLFTDKVEVRNLPLEFNDHEPEGRYAQSHECECIYKRMNDGETGCYHS